MRPVPKPDAGDPHVHFDELGRETALWWGLWHGHEAKAADNSEPPRLRPPRPSLTLPPSHFSGIFQGPGRRKPPELGQST